MTKKLENLKARREQCISNLKRIAEYVDNLGAAIDETEFFEISVRLEKLQLICESFESIQGEIEIASEFDDSELDSRVLFENQYFSLKADMKKRLSKFEPGLSSEKSGVQSKQAQPTPVQFPLMNLPRFTGEYHLWPEFRDSFLSLIDNNSSFTNVQKFHYLRSCLDPVVLDTIRGFSVTNKNYPLAWERLKDRYEREDLIASNHIDAIFDFPKLLKESSSDLRSLHNCVHNSLEALRDLGIAVDQWDLLLIRIVRTKLDPVTFKEWEKLSASKHQITFSDLLSLLTQRADFLERLERTKTSIKPFEKKSILPVSGKMSTVVHVQSQANQCKLCNKDHPTFKCDSFLKLTVHERIKKVKEKGLCLNCLRGSHTVRDCTSSKCRKCGKLHNTLLHIEYGKPSEHNQNSTETVENSITVATTQTNVRHNVQNNGQVILPTATVLVADVDNDWHGCRVLLDSGAMSNFISKDLCERLRLPVEVVNCSIKGVGQSIQNVQHRTTIKFSSHQRNGGSFEISCLVIDQITSNLPLVAFDRTKISIPKSVVLADPAFNKSGPIDLLIGSSIFWELLEEDRLTIPQTHLVLQKTKLGWIVGGLVSFQYSKKRSFKEHMNCLSTVQNSLDHQIQKFWDVEEINPNYGMWSKEENYCDELFSKTHTRGKDGHFIVKIPFKSNLNQLGASRESALRRFFCLERKLARDNDAYSEYRNIMQEYITMKHMKLIDEDPSDERKSFYIPHHAVVRKDRLTTKTRVVFDASMKSTSGLSLNDVQFAGPTIQNEIFAILINFRLHRYIMSGDISKMYRMVWLHDDHKSFHRIFWRNSPHEALKCYELQTVTFGTTSAPFLAIRCLYQLALENEKDHPKASKIIANNFYVDDLICGGESIDELVELQHEITSILSPAGFHLRKWLSNEPGLYPRLKLNSELECNTLQFGDKANKTLGISWNTSSDSILYSNYQFSDNQNTKRTVLSELSKIFDPLGLVGPILVLGKLIMQQLWLTHTPWDETIPVELNEQWSAFCKELNQIRLIQIQRRVLLNNYTRFDMHGFCDASEKAYGACVYIRTQDNEGNILAKLLCSKNKVAPLKTISLPKLELSAALLLARMSKKVLDKIEIKPTATYYWTDSTITLSWIQSNASRWKTFVSNRVGEIQQITEIQNWHHVRSSENPADILSRGSTVKKLIDSEIWWSGPPWLKSEAIPFNQNFDAPAPIEMLEEKLLIHVNTIDSCELFSRYSSFRKLQQITAYCFRFIQNCKATPESRTYGELTISELQVARNRLLLLMQKQSFPKDYQDLKSSKPLHPKSRLIPLNPFLDNHDLIRVGGRLDKSELNFDSKHPIILAPGHILTKLIISHLHVDNFHCGPTALLSFVRQQYWPIDGRNTVKGVIRRCRVCFLAKPKTSEYLMGQLPACRVTQCFPFSNVGIDYAGPVLIKDRKARNYKTLKAYICLFICMATKAIHLEVVTSLTVEAFFASFKRFTSRRGKPSHIFSDNAKNFVGANIELKRIYEYMNQNSSKIDKFLSRQQITWHFMPPRSPTFGGIWEAGIKSVKSHLHKIMQHIKFDYEDLTTILCQIEAVLNSRPLTPLTNDPSDYTPLTPGHFLIGRSINQSLEISHPSSVPTSRLKHHKRLESILAHFWKRWSSEYIKELQTRSKWKRGNQQEATSIKVGKLVLVKEDSDPFQWPLGRITDLHPGADGITRVVSVRVKGSTIRRGLSNICPLPEDD